VEWWYCTGLCIEKTVVEDRIDAHSSQSDPAPIVSAMRKWDYVGTARKPMDSGRLYMRTASLPCST